MEIRRFYREIQSLHVNTLEPHAYFIPFAPRQDPAGDRETSALFSSLNGTWDFAFFENVELLPIEEPDFLQRMICRDKLEVPGCWQLMLGRGYDVPNYINQDYPYPVDPPHLPDVIPCGFYRKKQKLNVLPSKMYRLCFEGVSSCFYLWVNGAFIGYSQVSHATAEFDVTNALINGENVFEVLVVKHCTGSYMEDQDFFRLSGIFRDVYVLERSADRLEDLGIRTTFSDGYQTADLELTARFCGAPEARYKLCAPNGEAVAEGKLTEAVRIRIPQPQLWSAEVPRLYSLTVKTEEETVYFPVGLREARIENRCLLFNGKKIKLRGINRHDTSPETGYYVTPEEMLRDLYLLKRANVNAIRTSHYPNDPRFLELCDRLGFYLIDEADLETHGLGYNYGDWYWDYWAYICDAPEWTNACVDRAKLLYERDKNHACVIMWSLGNESGCGDNHRAMAAYIRGRDDRAIIHYENARLEYETRVNRDFKDISDVESRMYASLDYLREYLNDKSQTKPFFYCEYASAWSTGDIPLHWDEFERYDNYCGGCVWEFADHAVNVGTKSEPKYRYGGDFGDYPNDGVYCIDGLVYPDRTPKPGYYDMKDTYKPFSVRFNNGKLTVFNKYYFKPLDGSTLNWTLERNGEEILSGSESMCIPPRGETTVELNLPEANRDFITLNCSVLQDTDTPWAEKGFEIGHTQFILHNAAVPAPKTLSGPLSMQESRTNIVISNGRYMLTFDKTIGKIVSIRTDTEYLSEPVSFSVFRSGQHACAAADWKRARYEKAFQKTYSTEILENTVRQIVIRCKISLSAAALPPAVKADVIYTFRDDGTINLSVSANVTHNAPPLPRFGVQIVMQKRFDRLSYLGFGPKESYPDRFRSQKLRRFETTVADNYEHYIKPDECGAHYAAKTAKIRDEAGKGLAFTDSSEKGFLINAKHYTDLQLQNTTHDDELEETDATVVNVDYKMHADNPEPTDLEPWRAFTEKAFSFSWDVSIL
ncbi:MAG: DUF4981 domain-containing protein [Clostridia bacterium]|nr:DUF4981 domain-containing protein [Clostridia bacterium]